MSSDDLEESALDERLERAEGEFADETIHERFSGGEAGGIPEEPITDEMLRAATDSVDSWLVWNKGLQQRGFVPTETITPDTVDQLEVEYRIRDDPSPRETVKFKGREPRSNPVVVPTDPPVIYFTQGDYTTHAINGRTGEHFWKHTPEMPPVEEIGGMFGWHRGAQAYGDTVYLGLPTVEVLALDRYTGEQRWRKEYYSEFQREEMPAKKRISVTQAPVVFDGKVFIGQSGDFGGWTVMSALDAESGEVVWQQRTSPHDQWVGDSWRFSSTAPWLSPTIDPQSNTVFWSIGNPNPWFFPAARPGPNKYGDSVIAMDIDSGEVKWVNQILPHDVWDYDTHATPTVFDMDVEREITLREAIERAVEELDVDVDVSGLLAGLVDEDLDDVTIGVETETRRVLSTDHKTAYTYVFDVETGRLVERSAPWAKQEHTWAETFLSLPPVGEENAAPYFPGEWGATEWPPDTYSPVTGLRYVGANNAASRMHRAKNWNYTREDPTLAIGGASKPIRGGGFSAEVVAVDPESGDVAWTHPLEHVKSKWPMARLYTGGTTATAGNVVFHASSSGFLKALHAETGELLWEDKTDQRIFPSPVVWEDPTMDRTFVSVFADEFFYTYSLSHGGDGGGS